MAMREESVVVVLAVLVITATASVSAIDLPSLRNARTHRDVVEGVVNGGTPWERSLLNDTVPGFPIVAGPLLLAQDVTNRLYAFNLQSGAQVWTVPFHCRVVQGAAFDVMQPGVIFTGCSDVGTVFALLLGSGQVAWEVANIRTPTIVPIIFDNSQQMLVVYKDGALGSINPKNGAPNWNTTLRGIAVCDVGDNSNLPIAETDHHIFACTANVSTGHTLVSAFFKEDGKWHQSFDFFPRSVLVPTKAPALVSSTRTWNERQEAVTFFVTNTSSMNQAPWDLSLISIDTTNQFNLRPRELPLRGVLHEPVTFVQNAQADFGLVFIAGTMEHIVAMDIYRVEVAWLLPIPKQASWRSREQRGKRSDRDEVNHTLGPLQALIVFADHMLLLQSLDDKREKSYITVRNLRLQSDFGINVDDSVNQMIATDKQAFVGTNTQILGYNVTSEYRGGECEQFYTNNPLVGLVIAHPFTPLTRLLFATKSTVYSFPVEP